MNKKSVSRVDHEANEGLKEIVNEVPENKFQTTQQIASTDDAIKTEVPESSFRTKRTKAKGATLKQEAIADMISGSASAAGMGISGSGRSVSGTNGGVLGANNSTPIAGKSRADSRVGKKLDRTATKLNFTPCEQVIISVDESKPLADAADQDQGYNGTYRNESARSQKVMGAVPGDPMFQRSTDLITKDKLYFVEGQQVYQNESDRVTLYPTESCFNEEDVDVTHEVTYHAGNYLHRAMHFGLDESGNVRYFYADVDDLTTEPVDPEIANVSSAARLIKSNVAELDRQVIDTKAGDEKADVWSCLARANQQPTPTIAIMTSDEAETGAFATVAYSKQGTNMSFQLNRGVKDGLDEVGPAIEELVGWRENDADSDDIRTRYNGTLSNVFCEECYDKGDPSIMIAAYDSVAKYKNKADILLQPRGFRMHLQTADNNMNSLKVPYTFANVFAGQEVFSTIEHDYDPTLPICMTDKCSLITVQNFNERSAFYKYISNINVTYSSNNIEADYRYEKFVIFHKNAWQALNLSNLDRKYILYKANKGDGLHYNSETNVIYWEPDNGNLEDAVVDVVISDANAKEGYTLLGAYEYNAANDLSINVPIKQNIEHKTHVLSVTTNITYSAPEYYRGAGPFSYSYYDLRNKYSIDLKHPLIEGLIQYINNSVGAKFRSLLGDKHELFVPLVFSTQHATLAQLLICAAMPWIARVRLNSLKDVIYYEDNIHEYPFSKLASIKDIPFHNFRNFGYSGYDEPLETRIMEPSTAIQWVMPEFFWKVGNSKYVLPWYFNENEFTIVSSGKVRSDESAMSFPSIRSGIRLGNLDLLYGLSEKDVRLSLDRMTKHLLLMKSTVSAIKAYKYARNTDGQPYVEFSDSDFFTDFDFLACPRELGLCMDAPYGLFTYDFEHEYTPYALTNEVAPSFSIKIWTNKKTPVDPDILNSSGVNIDRAANYVQKWYRLDSSTADTDTVLTGLVFGMNDEGAATFKPYGALVTGTQYIDGPAIVSLQRSLWTRIQMLPFVISPFDGHATSGNTVRDIYDIAYAFGLCGFRASDYRESVYNREKEVINQGLLFTDDPWVISSPIIKSAAKETGIKNTVGYEINKQ